MRTKEIGFAKVRTIALEVQVPLKYKWLACQPWGEWVVFERKPVFKRHEEFSEGDYTPWWWACEGGTKAELSLIDLDNMLYPQLNFPHADAKRSLRRIDR